MATPIRVDIITSISNTGSDANEATWSHTCSGTDRYLLVATSHYNTTPVEVTYNGVVMTELAASINDSIAFQIWGMVNPPSGAHDVHVYMPTAPTPNLLMTATSMSLTGTDQSAPINTSVTEAGTGSSTTPTLALTSPESYDDEYVVNIMSHFWNTTTSTLGDDLIELSRATGGNIGTIASQELVLSSFYGNDITPTHTLSQQRRWYMANVALKPANPPTTYKIYAFSPAVYNTPFAGTVNRTVGETDLLNTIPASYANRMLRYSDGMATLDVTVDSGRTVGASEYVQSAALNNGWYIRTQEARTFLAGEGVDLSPYDFVAVLMPDSTNTLTGIAGTAHAPYYGWWSELDDWGVRVGIHEMAHVVEYHLRTQGYTNFPTCDGGDSGTNSIHCGVAYSYPDSNDDAWYHDWYTGTVDGTLGVNATGWAKPTILEYLATLRRPTFRAFVVGD